MRDIELFSQLLGLTHPWELKEIEPDLSGKKITLKIEYPEGARGICPECKQECPLYDRNELKRWRHLDTMQFETLIECRVPRSNCKAHGIKTIEVPWAGKRSQFTLLFERFAVEVLLHSSSKTGAMGILRLSWDEVDHIQKKAVERGIKRRSEENKEIERIGIDEKSFLKGQSYISIVHNFDTGHIIEVAKGRDEAAARELLGSIPEEQRKSIKACAMDMWLPFLNAFSFMFPNSAIVHDKFHVSKYLNEAVDKVRKRENKKLLKEGYDLLKGTKYLWLKDISNFCEDEKWDFDILKSANLEVGRAWTIKENFRHFWDYKSESWAIKFFKSWFFWATHSKLEPVIKCAHTIKRHFDGILNYIKNKITNSKAEGLNSKIQAIKYASRGFRNFENYRTAILFHCGGFKLYS